MGALAVIVLRPGPFLAIITAAAIAATVAALASSRGLVVPVVVIELVAGVIIGPHVLGLQVDDVISFFSDLGLALLFFFAGYEIDLHRISGEPLELGLAGWLVSLAIAYSLAGLLSLDEHRAVGSVHRIRAGDDRHRDPDPDPVRQRRAAARGSARTCSAPARSASSAPCSC